MRGKHVLLLAGGVFVGVFLGAVLTRRKDTQVEETLVLEETIVPSEAPAATSGLTLFGDRLVVTDETRAFATITSTIKPLLDAGWDNPEQLLTYVMQRQFPNRVWPPPADSMAMVQWTEMVERIAMVIGPKQPTEPPRERLKVVK